MEKENIQFEKQVWAPSLDPVTRPAPWDSDSGVEEYDFKPLLSN